MLLSADKLFGDAHSLFLQDSAPAQGAKTTGNGFADHDITGPDWPANPFELNPTENLCSVCQEDDKRRQMPDLTIQMSCRPPKQFVLP